METTTNDINKKDIHEHKYGKACMDREETAQAIRRLLDGSQRTSLENVHGKGPLLLSDIPSNCQKSNSNKKNKNKSKIYMGIDEAGRGPALGPMVYAAAYWLNDDDDDDDGDDNDYDKKDPRSLFRDSKTLTAETRSQLFQSIEQSNNIGFAIRVLHASEISRNMLRTHPYNLNQMSHDAVIQMISHVRHTENVEIDTCFVDTVGIPEHYQRKLEQAFPYEKYGIQFVVEKKADAKYPTCSAASVLAKVTRDRIMDHWVYSEPSSFVNEVHDCQFGSGYPSDPKCKSWMEQNLVDKVFGYPDVVRFSWGPAKLALKDRADVVEWPDDGEDDEEGDDGKHQVSMTSFFSPEGNGESSKKRKRFDYLQRMGLNIVSSVVQT